MTIFSKIVAGEIPCYKVAEDENFLAFLDINPLKEAHTLVVPKRETDYIFDIEDKEYLLLMKFAKKVAAAIKQSVECKRVGMAVIGLEVPHAHIHLIPISNESDMVFANPKLNIPAKKMQDIALRLNHAFTKI